MSENKIKRFVLMAGSVYYPSGGFDDYKGSYDTEHEARLKLEEWKKREYYYWYHIFDLELGKNVDDGGGK